MQGFKRKIISKLILTMDLGKRINMERTLKLVEDEKFKQKHYDLFKEKFYNESYFNYSKEKESKLKEASKLRKTTREKHVVPLEECTTLFFLKIFAIVRRPGCRNIGMLKC